MTYRVIPITEIRRARNGIADPQKRVEVLSDMFRYNTLTMIKQAGSGHIGTSLSVMEILTWLWMEEMEQPNEVDAQSADLLFSSKGHDAPALYALLIGLEKLDFDLTHGLRRLHGLPGHPDIATPYILANTGSLGMGISKARGMAIARRLSGKTGRIFVVTGDGELQEGQFWESLQPAANGGLAEITAIVDANKIQSDTWVRDVSDLGALSEKIRAFGWEVIECDGHDLTSLKEAVARARSIEDRPQIIIADTIKGKGVSFMEGERGMTDDGLYRFHGGALSDEQYALALQEIHERISNRFHQTGMEVPVYEEVDTPSPQSASVSETIIKAYGDELAAVGEQDERIMALDADLVVSTGLVPFRKKFPGRFIECGIAEQDMVSVASGLALEGKIPLVHSLACFLAPRPNEQIYNNATELTKIIYVGSLAGLLPGFTGHSHQSVRDIACLGAIPNLTMFEPSNTEEARMALRWAVSEEAPGSVYLRLVSMAVDTPYSLPESYVLREGQGVEIVAGKDVAVIAYGPVMLSEAVRATDLLAQREISVAVINLPWLNVIDERWLIETLGPFRTVVTVDDHYISGGQGERIGSIIARNQTISPRILHLGVSEIPVCGTNEEVLRHHRLDAQSVAEELTAFFQ